MNRRRRPGAAPGPSPAWLLDPGLGVVPFAGRQAELATLLAWCLDRSAGPVRLVSGGGGAGKTRLALELGRELTTTGWRCEWLRTGDELDDTSPAGAGLLLVVDEAEPRADLADLLAAAARLGDRMRVLLLARATGSWLERLQAAERPVAELAASAGRLELALADALTPGVAALDVVRGAMPYFAERLGVPAYLSQLVNLTGLERARVLDLHAAALLGVIETARGNRRTWVLVDAGRALEHLPSYERNHWRAAATERGLAGGRNAGRLDQFVAVGCLLGAGTQDEAAALAGRLPGVAAWPAAATWLRQLYPAGAGNEWLGPLLPGRLAELHVTRELTESPALARQCLTGLDHRQARRALILLARAAADQPDARRLLGSALTGFPEMISGGQAPQQVVMAIASALPSPSLALAEAEASLIGQVIAAAGPGTADRAAWLTSYSRLLARLERRDEALAAASEAVGIYREEDPEAYRPALAAALTSLSDRLAEHGRWEDALAASSEAVATYRARGLSAFRPGLAIALIAHSTCLLRAGRRGDALIAVRQSVAINRKLAAARPGPFRPLAAALTIESTCLGRLGRPADALTASSEAVPAYRDLAAARPDAFRPDLAVALVIHSACLAGVGRHADALAAAEEATSGFRQLTAAHPGRFGAELAMALGRLSSHLSALGRDAEAEAARREAAETGLPGPSQ